MGAGLPASNKETVERTGKLFRCWFAVYVGHSTPINFFCRWSELRRVASLDGTVRILSVPELCVPMERYAIILLKRSGDLARQSLRDQD